MSNMSYCRFGNTLDDLEDCRDAMQGVDKYYQCKKDLSDNEFSSMERLIDVCREITEMYDNEEIVLFGDGDKTDASSIEDDDDDY